MLAINIYEKAQLKFRGPREGTRLKNQLLVNPTEDKVLFCIKRHTKTTLL